MVNLCIVVSQCYVVRRITMKRGYLDAWGYFGTELGGDGCAYLRWRLFGLDCGVGDVEGAIDASFVFCCR
jgi:hypothetical protein